MQNINKRMGVGIIWMIGARLMDRSIGILSTLILARLLVPGDFGLIAMATAVGAALDLLGAFSFDMALIQNSQAEPKHYNTVWTFNVIFGLICGSAIIALAHPVAEFYRESRLVDVMYVLSISYFVNAFSNVGVVNFRKNLQFGTEFLIIFIRRLVTFVITMIAAFTLRSYWALLIGMTSGRVVGVILTYTMNTYRPRLTLSAAKELFHFSKWLLLNNFLVFILNDGCTFIIGRLFGATSLGIYSVANEISSMPTTELVAPINRATFPGFSKMVDRSEMSKTYLKLLGLISLLILPVGLGIAAVAEPLVHVALGEKWVAAIPLIQILALYGAFVATQGNNGTVWLALGKTRELTINMGIFITVFFPALYYFINRFGIVGAGYAYLAAALPSLTFSLYVTRRLLAFTWKALFDAVWCPIIAACVMYTSVVTFNDWFHAMTPIVRLFAGSLIGAVVYGTVIILLWLSKGRPKGAEFFCLEALTGLCKTLTRKYGGAT